ncbi:MAG: hypothetical protein E7360_06825 [Clostridiales bacterium]|nr:hypothetical protein [Clostridiales bacterium]
MKRLFKGVMAICIAVCCIFSVTACDEVKNGSKIKTVTITFDVNGKEEAIDFELYLNLAPATIEHFEYLATKNYYNDTVVSNINKYIEFGAWYGDKGAYVSKYADGATVGYSSIIDSAYTSGKTIGSSKTDARYNADGTIIGEFARNGYSGNSLDLSGALVLKRDVSSENDELSYNTGKATMAVTFGSGGYFSSKDVFAIIGKVVTDDATDGKDSSYERLQTIMEDYAEDDDGNVYYFYTGDVDTDGVGNYFMYTEDGEYLAKDDTGAFTVELTTENNEDLLKDFADNADSLKTIPYGDVIIKVKSITFSK